MAGNEEAAGPLVMTKLSKKTSPPKPTEDGPTFEQALQRLETLVTAMEAAELPLEELLQKYEEGIRLVRFCSAKLTEAEKKIEILAKRADGSVEAIPFVPKDDVAEDDAAGKLF
jgi:exodeoxyribonuclease VII small subunit